jgi:hypothetical protein
MDGPRGLCSALELRDVSWKRTHSRDGEFFCAYTKLHVAEDA